MEFDDLTALIELQQAGAVVGMVTVFPQDRHPFPRETILARWREELADPAVDVYAAVDEDGVLVGFAATCGSERLHFGTAIETWGSRHSRRSARRGRRTASEDKRRTDTSGVR